MKKLLLILLMFSFSFTEEIDSNVVPCEGTCLSEQETKDLFNNIKELQFDLDKYKELNLQYDGLIKDYEKQLILKDEMIDLVKPKWYDNKYLWFFGGILITSGSIYLAGQID
mgnify:FL=1|tara:strand:- start:2655 stop:2990 length:336 start_codon:yes stop_codon:yes gene_type:complete